MLTTLDTPPRVDWRGVPTDEPGPPALHLADGIELLGEYRDSGYSEAPYLIRRGDGHNIQVSRLVYLVAEALDRHHDPVSVAAEVTRRFGRDVSPDNILYLVEHKLVPVGVVPSDDPEAGPPVTASPLLALRLRVPLIPERLHAGVTTALIPLFWPPVILAALAALVAVNFWLITSQVSTVTEGMQMILFEPKLLLVMTVLALVAGMFHEMGHAAAARYGGAKPGAMGAGIYLVWPVLYTDVTDTYRLNRRGRLRTDLGGVYFNVLFTLGAVWLYSVTAYPPLLVLVALVQFEILRQFLPFIRLDGFYVMSDLAGVPNLFAYMKPVLTVLVRRRDTAALAEARQKLQELNRRSRILITGWVLITAPILAVSITMFLFLIPRLAGMAWGSAGHQIDGMTTLHGSITPVGVANGIINLVLLALPVAGMTYILVMLLKRGVKLAARTWPARPAITGLATCAIASAVAFQVSTVWPGTFASALQMAREVPAQGPNLFPVESALSDLPGRLDIQPAGFQPEPAVPLRITSPDVPDDDPKDEPDGVPTPGGQQFNSPAGHPGNTTTPSHSTAEPPPSTATDQPPSPDPQPGRAVTPSIPTTTTATGADQPEERPPDREPRPMERLAGALRDLFEG